MPENQFQKRSYRLTPILCQYHFSTNTHLFTQLTPIHTSIHSKLTLCMIDLAILIVSNPKQKEEINRFGYNRYLIILRCHNVPPWYTADTAINRKGV